MFKCEFCETEFTVKSSLVAHQKSAKYCLEAQGVDAASSAKCEFCEKVYTKQRTLIEHLRTCPIKKQHDLQIYYEQVVTDLRAQHDHQLQAMEQQNLMLKHRIDQLEEQLQTQHEKYKNQEMSFQQKYYEAILQERDRMLQEKDVRIEKSEKERKKCLEDITDMARQTKTKNTTTNIMINNTTLDLQNTDYIQAILKQHLDINVLAQGQRGVARMLKDKLLTDEQGQKRYRCTDANRGNFEYTDPNGHVERDPKAAKLRDALIKSDLKDLAYNRGEVWWKQDDGSMDMARFDAVSDKVQEVATLDRDDTKFRTELCVLMS